MSGIFHFRIDWLSWTTSTSWSSSKLPDAFRTRPTETCLRYQVAKDSTSTLSTSQRCSTTRIASAQVDKTELPLSLRGTLAHSWPLCLLWILSALRRKLLSFGLSLQLATHDLECSLADRLVMSADLRLSTTNMPSHLTLELCPSDLDVRAFWKAALKAKFFEKDLPT